MNKQILKQSNIKITRALISVSDKTGVVDLGKKLHKMRVEILSTGGTAKALREAGIPVTDVSDVTKFPECLNGRVKTLHPMIHGALLARPGLKEHAEAISTLGIKPIQLVVVNLYPFQDAVSTRQGDLEHAVENIDIGGPAMIRAAAKNFENVCVLTNPDQYGSFIEELEQSDSGITPQTRARLSQKAFQLTASYDAYIAGHFRSQYHVSDESRDKNNGNFKDTADKFADRLRVDEPLFQPLRYGENPHQPAAVYGDPSEYIDCFHGKELSYNNYLDADAALQLGADFQESKNALCAIFKHSLPCGVAIAENTLQAWNKAFATDTVSPFGGVIMFNGKVNKQTAQAVNKIFSEIILAPDFEDDALQILTKKANRRLIRIKKWPEPAPSQIRTITGGYLLQHQDFGFTNEDRKVVTKKSPDKEQLETLEFAWKVVKHVKSNAIVYAKNGQTIGIGTGQPSRVDSSRIAAHKAKQFGHSLEGSVVASDAFFPFADGVEEAAHAGATAIIQPGGSVRDEEVIKTADTHNMSMVLTSARHFRH